MKKLRRQKQSSGQKSESSSLGKQALVVIGLALAFAFWRQSGSEPPLQTMAARDAAQKAVVAPSPRPLEIPISEAPKPQSEVSIQRLRAQTLLNRELGIERLKLNLVDGVIKIPFVFKAQKQWCRGGDLDTVKFLRPEPNALEFLVVIEALTGKQRGDRKRVSAEMLFQGFEKTFDVTVRNPSESFGLYICRDLRKTNSCRGKVLETHQDIANKLADNKTSAEALTQDYQLYFQNFVIKDGELITYDNTDIGKDRTDKLMKQLKTAYGIEVPDFLAAWEVTKILRSVPAKIEDNKISLILPYNDPRCTPGAERAAD